MKTLNQLTKAALFFVALLAGTAAFAQQGQGAERPTPEARAEMQVKRYEKQLELTPEQSSKIRAILLASAQEVQKLATPGQKPDREAMKALSQKRTSDIKAVLTPAQQEKFAQAMAQQMERGKKEQAADGQDKKAGEGKAKKGKKAPAES